MLWMQNYFKGTQFQKHRSAICEMLEEIPFVQSPENWDYKGRTHVGGLEYFGFTESADILCIVSSSGRSLVDMEKDQRIARDYSNDFSIDERLLICDGFDMLEGIEVKLAGKYGSLLPLVSKSFETLLRVSPLYPCEDVVFQPPFKNCFINGHDSKCVRIFRGYLRCYGFSFSGNYFVIADDSDVYYWGRNTEIDM